MKTRQLTAMVAVAVVLGTVACKEKKQSDDIIAPKVEVQKPGGPVRMQGYDDTRSVTWLGKDYKVRVVRTPDDSLQLVKDETGQAFVDNRISLTVMRADGTVAISKTFVKATFDAYLNDDYRRTGILEGLVFDGVSGTQLSFAASVSHPQTDEYIPLEVKIDNMGSVSIRRDNQMDTHGADSADAEDED